MANDENLRPVKTKKEARDRGRIGGIKSGEAKREKKLLKDIYASALAKKYGEQTGADIVEEVVMTIIQRKDAASVSMIRELREGVDGSKIEHSGELTTITDTAKRRDRIEELRKRLGTD